MTVIDESERTAPNGSRVERQAPVPPRSDGVPSAQRGRFVGPVDLRRTGQVVAGAVLVAIGSAAMLLGYSGAARTPLVEEQVPYLISGGIVGLALVVLGGFLFWAHWLFRQYERTEYHEHRRFELSVDATDRTLAALEALRAEVEALRNSPAVAGQGSYPSGALLAAEGDDVVHDAGCPLLASKQSVRPIEHRTSDTFRPCPICEPAVDPGDQQSAPKPQKRRPVRRAADS